MTYDQCTECKVLIAQPDPMANAYGMMRINRNYINMRLVCDECADKLTKTLGVKDGWKPLRDS